LVTGVGDGDQLYQQLVPGQVEKQYALHVISLAACIIVTTAVFVNYNKV
jgi:hypothetical protein